MRLRFVFCEHGSQLALLQADFLRIHFEVRSERLQEVLLLMLFSQVLFDVCLHVILDFLQSFLFDGKSMKLT